MRRGKTINDVISDRCAGWWWKRVGEIEEVIQDIITEFEETKATAFYEREPL